MSSSFNFIIILVLHHMPGLYGQLSRASCTPWAATVLAKVWGSLHGHGAINMSCMLAAFLCGASVLSWGVVVVHAVVGAVIAVAQACYITAHTWPEAKCEVAPAIRKSRGCRRRRLDVRSEWTNSPSRANGKHSFRTGWAGLHIKNRSSAVMWSSTWSAV